MEQRLWGPFSEEHLAGTAAPGDVRGERIIDEDTQGHAGAAVHLLAKERGTNTSSSRASRRRKEQLKALKAATLLQGARS